jgi:hypothetical protein
MDVIGFFCISLGGSTVHLHENLCSRRACPCSEAGFISQNGDRTWGVYYRRAAFCYAFPCEQKESMQRIFIKKCFLFTVGSVWCAQRFTSGSRNWHLCGKRFADDEEVQTELWKWLRQQSKDFYAAVFDALTKQWDKCINVSGGYVEK